MDDRLRVGVITTTHGVKGEVRVYPTTDDVSRFENLEKCYLAKNDGEAVEVRCVSRKYVKNMVVLKFQGYDNIEAVQCFKDCDILVDREDAVPLEDGEFFICDILDADVYDQNDEHIGTLADVLETPANKVLSVKLHDDTEMLIPMVPDFLLDVDVDVHRIKVKTFEMVEVDDE